MISIRRARMEDAENLKDLYFNHLTANPPTEEQDMNKWQEMISTFETNKLHHLLVGEINNKIVSSVTLIIIENLTHNMSPFAVIQNVVTHSDYRGKHYGTALMNRASEIATQFGCDKVMLMTGSKLESTLNFYENCGFNKIEKTGFLKRLKSDL